MRLLTPAMIRCDPPGKYPALAGELPSPLPASGKTRRSRPPTPERPGAPVSPSQANPRHSMAVLRAVHSVTATQQTEITHRRSCSRCNSRARCRTRICVAETRLAPAVTGIARRARTVSRERSANSRHAAQDSRCAASQACSAPGVSSGPDKAISKRARSWVSAFTDPLLSTTVPGRSKPR